jgi:FMN phosphatase YigB (HAD superfamily)
LIEYNNSENLEVVSSFLKNKQIKHYSFDFWNTIAFSNPKFKEKRAEYISNMLNNEVSIISINAAFQKIGQEYNQHQESGKKVISPYDLLEKVIIELTPSISHLNLKDLKSELDSIFIEYPPFVDKRFINLLESILASGKTCSLTSNTAFISGHTIKLFLDNVGLLNKFSFCIFSNEVGCAKPNSGIYQLLLLKVKNFHSNLEVSEIIHIGDNKVTDYNGATHFGLRSFLFYTDINRLNERHAVHLITKSNVIPFNPMEYSKFKFGDNSIAKKYGQELFDYFKLKQLKGFLEDTSEVTIYSSPNTFIPTSSYFLTHYFVESFNKYITENNISTKIHFKKINRLQTYIEDYGAMDAKQRFELIKNDTYSFSEAPSEKSKLIFIDDISITGTHQRVIEKLLQQNSISNNCLFLYYAKLCDSQISSTIENEFNFSYIKSLDDLQILMTSGSFKLTTRATKFILNLNSEQFNFFLTFLNTLKNQELAEKIYYASIKNGYQNIDEMCGNLSSLNLFVLKKNDCKNKI